MSPDLKLILEILGVVVASILVALSYTDDIFSTHTLVQNGLITGLVVWVMIRIRPTPKRIARERLHYLPKRVVFVGIYWILVSALMFYVDVSIVFYTSSLIGDSAYACCKPNLVVLIVAFCVVTYAVILSVKPLWLLISVMVSHFRSSSLYGIRQ